MSAETRIADDCSRSTRPRPVRRTLADRLRAAVMELSQHRGQIITHSETPWASITFAGSRHRIALVFAGDAAVAAGEDFIAELPEHEFSLPGHLVADAAICEVDHRIGANPRLAVTCELLLLEDG